MNNLENGSQFNNLYKCLAGFPDYRLYITFKSCVVLGQNFSGMTPLPTLLTWYCANDIALRTFTLPLAYVLKYMRTQ